MLPTVSLVFAVLGITTTCCVLPLVFLFCSYLWQTRLEGTHAGRKHPAPMRDWTLQVTYQQRPQEDQLTTMQQLRSFWDLNIFRTQKLLPVEHLLYTTGWKITHRKVGKWANRAKRETRIPNFWPRNSHAAFLCPSTAGTGIEDRWWKQTTARFLNYAARPAQSLCKIQTLSNTCWSKWH